ncbi:hypothetical protein Hanom_Chr01g00088151 [Helianthus anomalus]
MNHKYDSPKRLIHITPLFPRVSPVGPVGDYRDDVGNNIVKPHNYIMHSGSLKINIYFNL